eukprot:6744006-Alexandrium_andersonii.AAC.1
MAKGPPSWSGADPSCGPCRAIPAVMSTAKGLLPGQRDRAACGRRCTDTHAQGRTRAAPTQGT